MAADIVVVAVKRLIPKLEFCLMLRTFLMTRNSVICGIVVFFLTCTHAFGQGLVLPGVGPVNRSMAGAACAAPLDAAGAIHWNPATLTGLSGSEFVICAELAYPITHISSTLPANSFGPGIPPVALSGTDRSASGVSALPTIGVLYQPKDSCWSYGLGLFTIGGFGVNYPANPRNPIVSPQPPAGFGAGPLFSRLAVLQIAPTAAVQLTPRLSFGFAPTLTAAELSVDPASFAAPDDANVDGFFTYPSATHGRLRWGGGFQLGLYYVTDSAWRFGASFKSRQEFETFSFRSADEIGNPRTLSIDVDYPMIVSWGVSYGGLQRIVPAVDIRYIDFSNAEGIGDRTGFDSTGAVTGLGWQSVWSIAAGVNYDYNDRLSLRLGYLFNQNPIRDADTFFNAGASAIYQQAIFVGSSFWISPCFALAWSYLHAFENSISGALQTPLGAVPGSDVTIEQSGHALVVGLHGKF